MKHVIFLMSVIGVLGAMGACTNSSTSPTTSSTSGSGASSITTLQTTDVKVGTGADATAGKIVSVAYTGWLYSESAADHHGTKFDSADSSQPLKFVLGVGSVIKGWDQGIVGMKVGGQRTLIIPPSLAYGSTGVSGVIPANATLVFDVQLLGVS